MRVRLFSDIYHVMTKIDWEDICTSSRRKFKRACTLLGLKNMMTYERVKPATAGPVADTYLELKMLCLFYFVLENEKNSHNVGTAVVPEKLFYFSPFYSFFYISILNLGQFISQFINVIVPNNDLLMDEMNVIYFAPKMVAIHHDLVTSNCC